MTLKLIEAAHDIEKAIFAIEKAVNDLGLHHADEAVADVKGAVDDLKRAGMALGIIHE